MIPQRQPHIVSLSFCKRALACAVESARAAGRIMRQNLAATKKVNEATQHDLKIELDIRCQKRIETILLAAFPKSAVLGEEGVAGVPESPYRWIVDPIDGTVNFTYGVPHACVSIAFQVSRARRRVEDRRAGGCSFPAQAAKIRTIYETWVGVVYDPFCDELWSAIRNRPAQLNGKTIQVSRRARLDEAIVALGFSKHPVTLKKMLKGFNHLMLRVRKLRIMGAAALDMAYVASGRFDAYMEPSVRLWDIAASGLILECAGGEFWHERIAGEQCYRVIATNGLLRRKLPKFD